MGMDALDEARGDGFYAGWDQSPGGRLLQTKQLWREAENWGASVPVNTVTHCSISEVTDVSHS